MSYPIVTAGLNLAIQPRPKGRPRFSRSGHAYTDAKTAEHERAIRAAWIKRHGMDYAAYTCPVRVSVEFSRALPKSIKHARPWTSRNGGDVDNLAKAVLDALNGIAWADDAQIVELKARKLEQTRETRDGIAVRVMYLQYLEERSA